MINDELEQGNLLMNVIVEELSKQRPVSHEDILDFDLYLADTQPACTFGVHDEFISSGRLDDLSMCFAGLEALIAAPESDTTRCSPSSTTRRRDRRPSRVLAAPS